MALFKATHQLLYKTRLSCTGLVLTILFAHWAYLSSLPTSSCLTPPSASYAPIHTSLTRFTSHIYLKALQPFSGPQNDWTFKAFCALFPPLAFFSLTRFSLFHPDFCPITSPVNLWNFCHLFSLRCINYPHPQPTVQHQHSHWHTTPINYPAHVRTFSRQLTICGVP